MLATDTQVGFFFAILNRLGFDPVEYKERAKEEFKLESFNDITSEQISLLINKMLVYAERKGISIKPSDDEKPVTPPHAPEIEKVVQPPDPTDEWNDEVPEPVKTPDKFSPKDWREIEHKFSTMCAHDWKIVEAQIGVFAVKKCLKCPSVQIDGYGKQYQLFISYKPEEEGNGTQGLPEQSNQ